MRLPDRWIEVALRAIALSSLFVLATIALFIVREGAPLVFRVGFANFFSAEWHPTLRRFGIAYMVVGSAAVTLGALALGVPLGTACALVLSEMAPPSARRVLKPCVEVLAGIPSVVYGFLGIALVIPWIREHLGGPGASALAGSAILAIMILPTIITVSIDALQAVPTTYREGSLAMGATDWQTTWRVVLPAARPGIVAAVILGMGRAVGETMAVVMVTGNAVQLPHSPLDPVRTLTANMALEMAYATEEHRQALFATGIVLFVVIMVLNTLAGLARSGLVLRHRAAFAALGRSPAPRAQPRRPAGAAAP